MRWYQEIAGCQIHCFFGFTSFCRGAMNCAPTAACSIAYHVSSKLVSPAFIRYNKSTAQHLSCAIGCSSRQQNVRRSLLVFRKHKTGFLASIFQALLSLIKRFYDRATQHYPCTSYTLGPRVVSDISAFSHSPGTRY